MKVSILKKEFDLPDEFVKLMHIGNKVTDKNGRVSTIAYMVSSSNSISVSKYLNDLEWDLTVRQPSYTHDRRYSKEARANIKRLRLEGNAIRKYLEYVLDVEFRKFDCPSKLIVIDDGSTEFTEISSEDYFRNKLVETKRGE